MDVPHPAHQLSYAVDRDIAHLVDWHGASEERLRQMLDENGVATFFTTIESLHRWAQEWTWYRAEDADEGFGDEREADFERFQNGEPPGTRKGT